MEKHLACIKICRTFARSFFIIVLNLRLIKIDLGSSGEFPFSFSLILRKLNKKVNEYRIYYLYCNPVGIIAR